MAVAYELKESGVIPFRQSRPGEELFPLKFLVTGASSRDAALAAVQTTATYRYAGYTRLGWSPAELGGGVWTVDVPYGTPDPAADPATFPGETLDPEDVAADPGIDDLTDPYANFPEGYTPDPFGDYPGGGPSGAGSPQQPENDTDPLGPEWGFDTTGGTKTVRVPLLDAAKGGLNSRYFGRYIEDGGGTEDAVDYGGLIGVKEGDQGRLEVEGQEVPDPKLELVTTRSVRGISLRYISLVAQLTGSVNKAPFAGYATGTLLFLGASGQYKPGTASAAGSWSITYRFAHSPSRVAPEVDEGWPEDDERRRGLKVAHLLYLPPGQTIEGWDLIDVTTRDEKHPTLNKNVPTASQFAVHRIFPRADFRFLGFRNFNF